MKFRLFINVLAATLPLLISIHCPAQATRSTNENVSSSQLNLLAMGDWGEGTSAQKAVADAMAQYVAKDSKKIAALLSLGDNFYVPLAEVDDPAWQTLFEQMYDLRRLNFPFYAICGNHEYDDPSKYKIEMAYARAHPQSRWKMPARWYRLDLPPRGQPMATILMLDSDQPNLTPVEWNLQIRWLKDELGKPRIAPWVICCGHHPLFSNGAAADNGILQHDWGTLFKKHHVDFYLCGHEHNLQHLEIAGWETTSFVIAGGGGAHPYPLLRSNRGPFSRSIFGFVHLDLTPQKTTVHYIGTDGKPLHKFERTKAGKITVLSTTPSDPGVDKPLEAILGIYGKLHQAQTQPTTMPTTRAQTRPVEP